MPRQIRYLILSRKDFCDIRPIRNHQLIGFTPKDEQASISNQVCEKFNHFFIGNSVGVVQQPSRVMLIA